VDPLILRSATLDPRAHDHPAHRMPKAHLPTTANDGCRTHGLIAESGHAESAKQAAPPPRASDITAGTTTNSTRIAPRIATTRALRGFMLVRAYASWQRQDRSRPGLARFMGPFRATSPRTRVQLAAHALPLAADGTRRRQDPRQPQKRIVNHESSSVSPDEHDGRCRYRQEDASGRIGGGSPFVEPRS